MSDDPTIPHRFAFDKDAVQLRHEAVEIVARHARGLSGTRGSAAPAPAPPLRADAARALEEGKQQLLKGCLAEALLRADTTIGLAPPGSDLLAGGWVLSGQVRLLQGNPQAARHAFARALDASPAHIEARLGLADALRAMHQGARAIPIYLEAIALSTDERERGELRLALADTYRATGNVDAARRVLRVRGVGDLGAAGQLRALVALLLPNTVGGWAGLVGVVILALLLALQSQPLLALLLLLAVAALYTWRRATRR